MGDQVKSFAVGDKVFGFNDVQFGGHADYLNISDNDSISTLPDGLSFYQAAPIMEGAHYALNYIKAFGLQPKQNVLVYGATGAIGSAAVQLLKYYQAHVTAVCNAKNVELVKSLGADVVIDYQSQDFTKTDMKFPFIFDAVGKSSFRQCKPLLTEKGIYVSTELGKNAENIFYALTTPLWGRKKVLFPIPNISQEDANFLKMLVETGHFRPVIDKEFRLDEIVDAYKYVEKGQKTGNVVLRIVE
jgi:NADPH:quinone reductase-like Zn-dependent oxidoreductase